MPHEPEQRPDGDQPTVERRDDVWVVLDGDGEVVSEHPLEASATAALERLAGTTESDEDDDVISTHPDNVGG